MRSLLAGILIFTISFAFGQKALIKGRVTDGSTREPLPLVTIKMDGKPAAQTDTSGNYLVAADAGDRTIQYVFVGYKVLEKKVSVKENDTLVLNVALQAEAKELGTVVVSAGKFEQKIEKVTVSMEVIKPALVENRNTTNMETIVDQTPGVNVMDGQVSIRGGSGFAYGAGSRVLLLVDDLPMLSADAGDIKFNFLPVENLEQIEVIKGASSALFGSSALNGVINIRTAYPRETPRTSVNIFNGVYDNPERDSLRWWKNTNPGYFGANFFHSRQIKNFDLGIGGNIFSDEGYRQGETEHRYRFNMNTRYRSKKVQGLSYGVNFNTMTNDGGVFLLWKSANEAFLPADGTLSESHLVRTNVDPFITYTNAKGNRHALHIRYFNTTNQNNTNQESTGDFYYGEYQYQLRAKNELTATIGTVASYSTVHSDSLYGNHTSNNFSVFAQLDKRWNRLSVSLGVRGEYFKVDTAETKAYIVHGSDTTTLPIKPVMRMGINYQLFVATHLRASFGQGYRFPAVAEKFVSTTVSGLKIFPNPSLQPETGWSAELGVRQGIKISEWEGYVDLAAFQTEYKNMIEFYFDYYFTHPPQTLNDITDAAGFKSQNVEHARISGFELEAGGEGKAGQVNVALMGGYTYLNPVIPGFDPKKDTTLSTTENVLKYRYKHSAKADVQLEYKKFSFGFGFRYNSFMVNIDRRFEEKLLKEYLPNFDVYILPGLKSYREIHNKGDLVFDLRIGFRLSKETKIAFIANNILNHEYMGRPGDVQPPRTFAVQVSVKL